MTKLVLVLAVVVVVILVVVIVAVRNMRTEDPDEFAEQRDGRGRTRGGQDDRDLSDRRRESSGRQAARTGRGARAAGPATGRDYRRSAGRGYDADQGVDQRNGRPYDERRGAPAASGPQKRGRPGNGPQDRPNTPAPARSRRRSGDSSEWDSSEWEQLSDVDYWTELASSKPMTSGTQPSPSRPAAHRGSAVAGPAQDLEPETMAVRSPAPGGGRADFAPAPVPADQLQDRQRPAAPSNGDRASKHHRRPAASQDRDRGQNGRPLPPAAPASDRGQRFLDAPGRDPGRYLDVGPASLPMPAIRDVPPARQARPRDMPAAPPVAAAPPAAPVPPARRQRPAPLDDDPLTSPSFPAVQASDSRSYRNRGSDTPPNGSHAPAPYPAAAPQRPSYDAPTAQYPGAAYSAPQYPTAHYPEAQYAETRYPEAQYPTAQYPTAQYPTAPEPQHSAPQYPRANGRGTPGDYRTDPPDPLTGPNPFLARAANGSAVPAAPPAHGPVTPASGNPYGSYVTPDSRQAPAAGYSGHATTPVNGNGQPYPAPAAPGTGRNGNGYWNQPDQAGAQQPDYRNGYGQHGQAGYAANGYPAGPDNPAGYTPGDPYGSDGYGGYPEYGAAER